MSFRIIFQSQHHCCIFLLLVLLGHNSLIKVFTSKRHKAGRKEALFIQNSVRAQQYAIAEIKEEQNPDAIIKAASQQPTTLGKLVRRSNSFKGQTAARALEANKILLTKNERHYDQILLTSVFQVFIRSQYQFNKSYILIKYILYFAFKITNLK